MTNEKEKAISWEIHESTLHFPWSPSGTAPDWRRIAHEAVDLTTGNRRELENATAAALITRHKWSVLLHSATEPGVLFPTTDALEDFDAILSGSGFLFGANRTDEQICIHIGAFAFFDGGDIVTFSVDRQHAAAEIRISAHLHDFTAPGN